MTSYKKHKVLIVPLDWGLGHATRCIPIIHALLQNGHEVLIGAENAQAILLEQEFPQLTIIPIKGYRVKYSKHRLFFALNLLAQLPRLIFTIRSEHNWLNKIVVKENISFVISDNRYGLHHATVPSIFITHQLTIKAPFKWIENILQSINYSYINRFSQCWVPDMQAPPGIAGVLSHPSTMPSIFVHYINLLSRFKPITTTIEFDICVLLSGPEPQRSILEGLILQQVGQLPLSVLLVRGRPADSDSRNLSTNDVLQVPAHVKVVHHLDTDALGQAIQQSKMVICRSGYTTLMELLPLKKKMILIPTPGQTEQEYLAGLCMQANYAFAVQQNEFDLSAVLKQAEQFEFKQQAVQLFDSNSLTDLLLL